MTTFENPAMGRRMDAPAPAGLPTETFGRNGRLMCARTLSNTRTRALEDFRGWLIRSVACVGAGDISQNRP